MAKVELRGPFDKVPGGAITVALALDAIDLFSNAVALALAAVFIPLGLLPDVGVDAVQSLIAMLAFKDPLVVLGTSADFILPPPLDLLPTATISVLVREGRLFKK